MVCEVLTFHERDGNIVTCKSFSAGADRKMTNVFRLSANPADNNMSLSGDARDDNRHRKLLIHCLKDLSGTTTIGPFDLWNIHWTAREKERTIFQTLNVWMHTR